MQTDFERRVSDALVATAPEWSATGLAEGARRRWRRRRLRRAGVAVVAVVAVAVPVGATLPIGEPERPVVVPAIDVPPSGVPVGWKQVAWRDLQVWVPSDWRDGWRDNWCAGSEDPRDGVIEWPGRVGVKLAIGCDRPQQGFGVTLGHDASAASLVYESGHVWQYEAGDVETYVPGSWLGYWYDDERMVSVNAGDRETVEQVLASVRRTG